MQYKIGSKQVSRQEFNSEVKKIYGDDTSKVSIAIDEGYGSIEDASYDDFKRMRQDGSLNEAVLINHRILLRPNKNYWDNEYETHSQIYQQNSEWY